MRIPFRTARMALRSHQVVGCNLERRSSRSCEEIGGDIHDRSNNRSSFHLHAKLRKRQCQQRVPRFDCAIRFGRENLLRARRDRQTMEIETSVRAGPMYSLARTVRASRVRAYQEPMLPLDSQQVLHSQQVLSNPWVRATAGYYLDWASPWRIAGVPRPLPRTMPKPHLAALKGLHRSQHHSVLESSWSERSAAGMRSCALPPWTPD